MIGLYSLLYIKKIGKVNLSCKIKKNASFDKDEFTIMESSIQILILQHRQSAITHWQRTGDSSS